MSTIVAEATQLRKLENPSTVTIPIDACPSLGNRTSEVFVDAETTAAWFGGITEPGTIVTIGVSEDRNRKTGKIILKTLPCIQISATNSTMLDRLYEEYGGQRNGRIWRKSGRVAAEIAASTLPFTVARREHARLMQKWLSAATVEEQISIARELQNLEWQKLGTPDEYDALLENPAFVAGILDSRAHIKTRPSRNYHTLHIQTISKNVALLTALKANFGGSIWISTPAGKEINNGTIVFETKEDSYVWETVGSDAINVMRFSFPFIQSPLPHGWDYQRAVEEQEEAKQLAEKVAAYIRWELEQLKIGAISRISTRPELEARFGIGHRRLSHSLITGLSLEEQNERKRKTK